MVFDTKIAVVVRNDLETWQKLNVNSFLVSGIGGTQQEIIGEPYKDKSERVYLPMSRQPIMVFAADHEEIKKAFKRSLERELKMTIYTEELFKTYNDEDNRAAVYAVETDDLNLVGFAVYGQKKDVDKALKGLKLHP